MVEIDQEFINDLLDKSCPEWRQRQIQAEREKIEEKKRQKEKAKAGKGNVMSNFDIKGFKHFVTGTQVYGPISSKSDIDIVMTNKDSALFEQYLKSKSIRTYRSDKQKEEYPGYYFKLSFLIINIVNVKDEEEFFSWKYATENMTKNVTNRKKRIEIFEQLKRNYFKRIGKDFYPF